jgi:hypothetical protein
MGMRASSRLNPDAEVFKIDEYHRGMAREALDVQDQESGEEEDAEEEDEDDEEKEEIHERSIKINITGDNVDALNAIKERREVVELSDYVEPCVAEGNGDQVNGGLVQMATE